MSKPPQYGFSAEALIGRRQILQAACDALSNPSSRSDYNRGLVEDNEATAIVDVSWDKVFVFLLLNFKVIIFLFVSSH